MTKHKTYNPLDDHTFNIEGVQLFSSLTRRNWLLLWPSLEVFELSHYNKVWTDRVITIGLLHLGWQGPNNYATSCWASGKSWFLASPGIESMMLKLLLAMVIYHFNSNKKENMTQTFIFKNFNQHHAVLRHNNAQLYTSVYHSSISIPSYKYEHNKWYSLICLSYMLVFLWRGIFILRQRGVTDRLRMSATDICGITIFIKLWFLFRINIVLRNYESEIYCQSCKRDILV